MYKNERPSKGDNVDFEISDEEEKKKKKKTGGFQSMGLDFPVYKAIIRQGYRLPTPIQRKTIPIIMQGADCVAMARTGSGKTAAFVIPMIQKLKAHETKVGVRALLLAPTRDLALQTHKVVMDFGKFTDLRTVVLVGGAGMTEQFEDLAQNPDIIIATPGRLLHHLVEIGMSLETVKYLCFDEADRLFEMGFADQINQILKRVSPERQTLLFSATMPKLLVEFARAGLHDPQLVRLDAETKISEALQIAFFTIRHDEKLGALLHILKNLVPENQQTMVFAATRHHVEFLAGVLASVGIRSSFIYGSMDPDGRVVSLNHFRKHETDVLIVTDVAARGIDIPLLDNVINYDFPPSAKLFVHRVGRVARAGRTGVAYNLVTPDEIPYMIDLHLFLPRPLQNEWKGEGPAPPNEVYYGNIPQHELDLEVEIARNVVDTSNDLQSFQRGMINATRLYLKTRQPASKTSVKRGKNIVLDRIHPMLLKGVDDEIKAREFLQQLRGYRPHLTVLEQDKSGKAKPEGAAIMAQKRTMHAKPIFMQKRKVENDKKNAAYDNSDTESDEDEVPRKTANDDSDDSDIGVSDQYDIVDNENSDSDGAMDDEPVSKRKAEEPVKKERNKKPKTKKKKTKPEDFRDSQFFMSYTPKDDATEKGLAVTDRDVVFDVGADDAEGLQKKKSVMKWDMKKKKYTMMESSADGKLMKKIRSESGEKIDAPYKTKMYEKWKATTKMSIPEVGDIEDPSAVRRRPFRNRSEAPNKEVKDEIVRDEGQLRKRKVEAERKKPHFGKGPKPGTPGGRFGARPDGKGGREGGRDSGLGLNKNSMAINKRKVPSMSGRTRPAQSGKAGKGGRGGKGGKGRR